MSKTRKFFEGSTLIASILHCGSSDGCISILTKDHIRDKSDWQSKMLTNAHEMGVNSVSWGNPTKIQFVSGGSDGLIKIWMKDPSTSEWIVMSKLAGHRDCVRDVSWSSSLCHNYIASCGQDMQVVIWRQLGSRDEQSVGELAASSRNWSELERIKLDHVVWTVSWCMTGTTLVVAGQDNRVRFFKQTLSGQFMEISSNKIKQVAPDSQVAKFGVDALGNSPVA